MRLPGTDLIPLGLDFLAFLLEGFDERLSVRRNRHERSGDDEGENCEDIAHGILPVARLNRDVNVQRIPLYYTPKQGILSMGGKTPLNKGFWGLQGEGGYASILLALRGSFFSEKQEVSSDYVFPEPC